MRVVAIGEVNNPEKVKKEKKEKAEGVWGEPKNKVRAFTSTQQYSSPLPPSLCCEGVDFILAEAILAEGALLVYSMPANLSHL